MLASFDLGCLAPDFPGALIIAWQAFAMAQAAQMSQMGTPGAQQQAYLSMSQAQPQPDPTAYPYNYGQY